MAGSKAFAALSTTGSQVGNAIKGVFGNSEAAAKASASVQEAVKYRGIPGDIAHGAGRVATKPFRMMFNGVVSVATWPIRVVDSIAGAGVRGYGNFFAKSPLIASAATVGAAALGVGHIMNKRAEARSKVEMAELGAMQAGAAQAQANSYSVTAADMAELNARMKQGGQGGSFADQVRSQQNVAGPAV